jgi:hypothetical protein
MRTTYLVCYDIADDKRLRKVFKTRGNFGDHSYDESNHTKSLSPLICVERADERDLAWRSTLLPMRLHAFEFCEWLP